MKISNSNRLRQIAPALVVLLACCLVTMIAFISAQRQLHERVALHAAADAGQFQRTLERGVDSYLHLNRDLAAYLTVAGKPGAKAFDTYMRTADALRQNPGLSYIGYIERIRRPNPSRGEPSGAAGGSQPKLRSTGPDPAYTYPYLYAYPIDERSMQASGQDLSVVPERWTAMQRARDTGQSSATARHNYVTATDVVPVIVVFTPVYDPSLPNGTVEERRVALQGFVFSIFHIEEMIERVMGREFRALFDLEIYDGAVRADALLYDGDEQPHVLKQDVAMPLALHAQVKLAGRDWQLFFFPKPAYFNRYHTWYAQAALAVGLALSVALAWLTWKLTYRLLARLRRRSQGLQFGAVFANHPSAVYELDLQRRFINANAQALKEFHVTREELIGKSADDFIVPENRAMSQSRFAEALCGSAVSYDSAIIDASGVRSEMSVVMIPLKTGSEVSSLLGIARNISAQKLGEWRLKESRNMLQLVINHLPQRVFWKDTNFVYLGCNTALARDAGFNHPDEIIGRTDFELAWRASADLYRLDDIETLSSGIAKINYEEPLDREDGARNWLRTSKIPLTDPDGDCVAVLGMYEDITARKQLEEKLRDMAHHDQLTGLVNRAFFYHHIELAMAKSRRHGSLMALMYFDIDHFKAINDSCGHDIGDLLLKDFADRVGKTVRDTDVFARLGGDEFALLVEELPDVAMAEQVASKLVEAMRVPFQIRGRTLVVSSSIGVAFFEPGMQSDTLIRRADQAMYSAKRAGRNRYEMDLPPASNPNELPSERVPVIGVQTLIDRDNFDDNGRHPDDQFAADAGHSLPQPEDHAAFGHAPVGLASEPAGAHEALQKIALSVSAPSNAQFLEQLASTMIDVVGADGGFIARQRAPELSEADTVIAVVDGNRIADFSYSVGDAQGGSELEFHQPVRPGEVDQLFARSGITALDMRTCAGCSISTSSGSPLGTVFVMFRRSIPRSEFVMSTLRIFAARAAAELERREAHSSLRTQSSLLDNAQDAIILRSIDDSILFWNKSAERMYGWTREEALGRNIQGLLRDDPNNFRIATQAALQTGNWSGETVRYRKDGGAVTVQVRLSLIRNDEGQPYALLSINTDSSQRIAAEREIERLAFYDPVTALPNRVLLLDRIRRALTITQRGGAACALMFIGLDYFKRINEELGHEIGDQVLEQVGTRLRSCVFEIDTVARFGSDEFVVLVENLSRNRQKAATQAKRICERILLELGNPIRMGDFERHITASIGVTMFDTQQCGATELLKQADLAMHGVKAAGRNGVRFFDPEMQAVVHARAALEADLRHALQDDEFVLHYQPQLDRDGIVTGAEALIRWQSPTKGLVSPATFIPLAEETGLIQPIGRLVLEHACLQLARWAKQPDLATLSISVNVSACQLRQDSFVDEIVAVLEHSGANPFRLKLELTESLLVGDTEATISKMLNLKARGVGFSLDDFGTGYSSLSYLKRLPLDQLKIDQSFVRDVMTDANDAAIVQTILSLGKCLNLTVIAEGVETSQQHEFLVAHGCHAFQGYHFSRPVTVDEFELFAGQRRVAMLGGAIKVDQCI